MQRQVHGRGSRKESATCQADRNAQEGARTLYVDDNSVRKKSVYFQFCVRGKCLLSILRASSVFAFNYVFDFVFEDNVCLQFCVRGECWLSILCARRVFVFNSVCEENVYVRFCVRGVCVPSVLVQELLEFVEAGTTEVELCEDEFRDLTNML